MVVEMIIPLDYRAVCIRRGVIRADRGQMMCSLIIVVDLASRRV